MGNITTKIEDLVTKITSSIDDPSEAKKLSTKLLKTLIISSKDQLQYIPSDEFIANITKIARAYATYVTEVDDAAHHSYEKFNVIFPILQCLEMFVNSNTNGTSAAIQSSEKLASTLVIADSFFLVLLRDTENRTVLHFLCSNILFRMSLHSPKVFAENATMKNDNNEFVFAIRQTLQNMQFDDSSHQPKQLNRSVSLAMAIAHLGLSIVSHAKGALDRFAETDSIFLHEFLPFYSAASNSPSLLDDSSSRASADKLVDFLQQHRVGHIMQALRTVTTRNKTNNSINNKSDDADADAEQKEEQQRKKKLFQITFEIHFKVMNQSSSRKFFAQYFHNLNSALKENANCFCREHDGDFVRLMGETMSKVYTTSNSAIPSGIRTLITSEDNIASFEKIRDENATDKEIMEAMKSLISVIRNEVMVF